MTTAISAAGDAVSVAINNAMSGKHDDIVAGALYSTMFGTLGYGGGFPAAIAVNAARRPTINTALKWAGSHMWARSGCNVFRPNNIGVLGANITGGTIVEYLQGTVNSADSRGQKR
ncbi:MAG: hypothetical protein ACRYGG_01385 [Janthinobacterium lividum]